LEVAEEINVLALVKGNERYVFLFDDDNRVETLRQIGRFAANPELSFTWYDAAVMSQKIRQTAPPSQPSRFDLASRFRVPLSFEEALNMPDEALDLPDDEEAA
jgi:hypothetical protein